MLPPDLVVKSVEHLYISFLLDQQENGGSKSQGWGKGKKVDCVPTLCKLAASSTFSVRLHDLRRYLNLHFIDLETGIQRNS